MAARCSGERMTALRSLRSTGQLQVADCCVQTGHIVLKHAQALVASGAEQAAHLLADMTVIHVEVLPLLRCVAANRTNPTLRLQHDFILPLAQLVPPLEVPMPLSGRIVLRPDLEHLPVKRQAGPPFGP